MSQVFLTSVVGCGWSSKGPAYVNLGIEVVHGKCKLINYGTLLKLTEDTAEKMKNIPVLNRR